MLSGLANVAAAMLTESVYPGWYRVLVAVGYGLLLPALAVLQVRHATVRQSGATLGTIAGMATITVGISASASGALVPAALIVRAVWWWTIGKIWAETAALPRVLGLATMALAAATIAAALASAPFAMDVDLVWVGERLLLGLWTLALSVVLWRLR